MRKILTLLFLAFILSGCATYKFQKPNATGEGSQGYLASYNDEPILEYTVGKEKSLPDLTLAKERFKRRRSTVEYYYKKMGLIEPRLKEVFWDPAAMCIDFLGGIFRWPFMAVADYKYNHNPKYKESVDKLDEQNDAMEKARIDSLKVKLAAYIGEDLSKEPSSQGKVAAALVVPKSQPEVLPTAPEPLQKTPVLPATQEAAPKAETPISQKITPQPRAVESASVPAVEPIKAVPVEQPVEIKPPVAKAPVIEKVLEPPVAVITAKPIKGFSPLRVIFSGQKTSSKNGKIIAYNWDFGDGDTSTKKNPENIYYSTTYGVRNFTVTLTVKDTAGVTSSTTSIIEVSTP